MIKSIWKPVYFKSKIIYYDMVEVEDLTNKKGTTAYKVIWVCDNPKCRTPSKIHSISAHHLTKVKNNFNIQICRPCQCSGEGNGRFGDNRKWSDFHSEERVKELKLIYSEKWKGIKNPSLIDDVKIKKNQSIINEVFLKKIVNKNGFKLLSLVELDGKNSKLVVECKNGHISNKRYVNFVAKHKKFICSKCFYNSIALNLSKEDMLIIKNYYRIVRSMTKKTYKQYKNIINPNNLKISFNTYHIDHKFSVAEGFRNNLPPEILSAKENLQILTQHNNLSKQDKCSITLDELIEKTKYINVLKTHN
jgi:hypothetical protein